RGRFSAPARPASVRRKSRTPAAPFAMDDAGLGDRACHPWHGGMGTDARSGIDDCRHHSRKLARTFLADFPVSASDGSRSPHRHVRGARSNSFRPLSHAAVVDLVRSAQRVHHFPDRRARESRNRSAGRRKGNLMNNGKKLDLVRGLGKWSSAAIVVGTMVGTGIFLKPSEMAADAGSLFIVLAAWVVG